MEPKKLQAAEPNRLIDSPSKRSQWSTPSNSAKSQAHTQHHAHNQHVNVMGPRPSTLFSSFKVICIACRNLGGDRGFRRVQVRRWLHPVRFYPHFFGKTPCLGRRTGLRTGRSQPIPAVFGLTGLPTEARSKWNHHVLQYKNSKNQSFTILTEDFTPHHQIVPTRSNGLRLGEAR